MRIFISTFELPFLVGSVLVGMTRLLRKAQQSASNETGYLTFFALMFHVISVTLEFPVGSEKDVLTLP